MWAGVRPIMRLASTPTASGRPSRTLTATTDGSFSTMPRPRTYTTVLAVPRSTAMSRPMIDERTFSDIWGGALSASCHRAFGAAYSCKVEAGRSTSGRPWASCGG